MFRKVVLTAKVKPGRRRSKIKEPKARVAIFGNSRSDQPATEMLNQLIDRLSQFSDAEYVALFYDEVRFELATDYCKVYASHQDQPLDLSEFSTVYLRRINDQAIRGTIARYCQHHKVRVVNSENLNLPLTSKLEQLTVAALNGVPIPKTFFAARYDIIEKAALDYLGLAENYIVKSITGSNGNHNFKVSALAPEYFSQQSVVQEYIENDYEYRVIVIDNQVALAYKKVSPKRDSHLNNIAKGGERVVVRDLPEEVADYALAMARRAGREIAGVDVVYDKLNKRHVLFEINFKNGHPWLPEDSTEYQDYLRAYDQFLSRK